MKKEKESFIKSYLQDILDFSIYALYRKNDNPNLISEIFTASLNLKGALLSSNQQIKDESFSTGDTSLINLYERWKLGKLQLEYYETTLQELEKNGG